MARKLFLEGNGFKKYYPKGVKKPTWVFIKGNVVTETSVELIKDYVLNYLLEKKFSLGSRVIIGQFYARCPNGKN